MKAKTSQTPAKFRGAVLSRPSSACRAVALAKAGLPRRSPLARRSFSEGGLAKAGLPRRSLGEGGLKAQSKSRNIIDNLRGIIKLTENRSNERTL